jgi:hypothetical protein
MTDFANPEAVKNFNKSIVDEFRANGGKVTGPFTQAALLLLTTTGAKSGTRRVSPLVLRSIRIGCTTCGPTLGHTSRSARRVRRDGSRTAARRA